MLEDTDPTQIQYCMCEVGYRIRHSNGTPETTSLLSGSLIEPDGPREGENREDGIEPRPYSPRGPTSFSERQHMNHEKRYKRMESLEDELKRFEDITPSTSKRRKTGNFPASAHTKFALRNYGTSDHRIFQVELRRCDTASMVQSTS